MEVVVDNQYHDNVLGELNSIEEICLKLLHEGWMTKKIIDHRLKRLGTSPSELQRRLKAVGCELFIITIPPGLNPTSVHDEWYVVLPQKGQALSDDEIATLTIFIGTVLLKGRPLTRLEMHAIFKSKFSHVLKQLMQKKLIIASNNSALNGDYTFSPTAKAIFRDNFEKIPDILSELIAYSSQSPTSTQ